MLQLLMAQENYMSIKMARLVSRISVKTIINQYHSNNKKTIFIAGMKVDKWTHGDDQYSNIKFCIPQEVDITIIPQTNNRVSDNSICRIYIDNFKLNDGTSCELKGWELCRYGIKFFHTQYDAEKYFLEKTHKLFNLINPITQLYNELYSKINYVDSNFIDKIN